MVILITHVMITQSTEMVTGDTRRPPVPRSVPSTSQAPSLSVMRPLLQAAPETGEVNRGQGHHVEQTGGAPRELTSLASYSHGCLATLRPRG